ncbi:MAG: ribonuclease HII [Pseudomonadota bacterium]|nr:ribonuclease HII [Pseudomonadota bacterium]
MTAPCFKIEKGFAEPIVGVDEAGRGPLAGPVVAAAVVLDRKRCPRGIDDSKKLCLEVRESIHGKLRQVARIGVGVASVEEIDRFNIFWATMLAMTRAVEALGLEPGTVLVDGNRCPDWRYASKAIVRGDAKSRSIAAASIVAKVTRDRMMADYCAVHPGYGWTHNRGYGTPEHLAALDRLGPTPLHRRSFAPVRQHMLDLVSPAGHTTSY